MSKLPSPDMIRLEDLIDEHSLRSVLEALSEICSAKSEHTRSNRQDPTLAKRWAVLSNLLDHAASQCDA